jgi:tRNA-specific 2-thiouridylase
VLDISPVSNTVTVGTAEELAVDALEAGHVRWCGPVGDAGFDCLVQLRAHGEPVPASAGYDAAGDVVTLSFGSPVRGIAPGQTAVLYDGTRVVGSATITATRRAGAVAAA